MNFYALPEFVSYCILVGIACELIRQKPDTRLRYWLTGWVLILFHSSIYMLMPDYLPLEGVMHFASGLRRA
jgi:hypothetical protein